jgi:hypothetical protein
MDIEAQVLSVKNRVNKWNNKQELGVSFDLAEPNGTVKRLWVALEPELVTWEKGDIVRITGEINKVVDTGDMAFLAKKFLTIRSTSEDGEAVKLLGEVKAFLGGDVNDLMGDFEISKLTLAQLKILRQIIEVSSNVAKANARSSNDDDIMDMADIVEAEGVV